MSHAPPERGDGSWGHSEPRGPPQPPGGAQCPPLQDLWDPLSHPSLPPPSCGDPGRGAPCAEGRTDGQTDGGAHLEVPVDHPHLVAVQDGLQDLLDAVAVEERRKLTEGSREAEFT